MLSSMYSSSIKSSNKPADQRSALVLRAAAMSAAGRASRRQRLSASCVERVVRDGTGFAPGRAEETRRALRFRGAGIVTFEEATGENLQFMASAIVEPAPMGRFAPFLCERPSAGDEIRVSDTQNVICEEVGAPRRRHQWRRRLQSRLAAAICRRALVVPRFWFSLVEDARPLRVRDARRAAWRRLHCGTYAVIRALKRRP